jgi:hypothetical protein
MLVYDAADADAVAIADRLRQRLPLGYPVLPADEVPPPVPPGLDPQAVRGTIAWLDVDGRLYTGRQAVAHALIACEGGPSVVGWLALTPLVGGVALAVWRALPKRTAATR